MMQIGIIGSGAMGSGIAQVAATAGHTVILFDTNQEALVRARTQLQKILNRLVEKGRMTDQEAKDILERHLFVDSMDAFKNCGLVIEAIVENLDIKRTVFQKLESIITKETILATNTSSLSVASIAAACQVPERVIGLHFFNPAPLMKLVEIIPALQTDPGLPATLHQLMLSWSKYPVQARDTPGFIVNRIARPFYSESIRILEEGLGTKEEIDTAMKTLGGFRMGPFELMDFIGHDVNYAVTESVWTACYYEPRYQPSFTQRRLVDAGWLGRKSGRGFYDYRPESLPVEPTDHADSEKLRRIFERIVVMLINEAADALYYNIASRDDIDQAMTLGVNYPKGLLRWADEWGIATCEARMDRLFSNYHDPRYRCSPMLKSLAQQGERFYPNENI